MTYEEVVELANNLGIIESFKFVTLGRGRALDRKYVKFKLKQDGRVPELSILFQDIEKRVGTKRTFSHNPTLATATVTLYED